MRVVAKVQLTAVSEGSDARQSAIEVLDRWRARKFTTTSDGDHVIRLSGARAELDQQSDTIDGRHLTIMSVLEPLEGGSLQTDIHFLTAEGRTAFRCVLRVGSDVGIAPAEVSIRPPRFVREIVALPFAWTVGRGGERVFAQCFPVDTDDVTALEELMVSPVRRLPMVIVSELDGETLAGDLHERLGQDLCGLAHVVRLSTEASWALTRSHGREWSCYNGAVRLLWPFRANRHDFRAHPLWTYDQMVDRFETAVEAREHLRSALASRIVEASTFVSDDPGFDDFQTAKVREAADRTRAIAAQDEDFVKLADLYAVENTALRARVDEQRADIERLEQNVESLVLSLRSSQATAADQQNDAPPQTIAEAVATARQTMSNQIVIARETDTAIADLNPAAGPPDKILRYLIELGKLADALAAGPLGLSIPIWLRNNGVDCSVESETSKGNVDAKRFRHRLIDGELTECEYHAKPSNSVSPDMCVRIYFTTALSAPLVRVGYIGRHAA